MVTPEDAFSVQELCEILARAGKRIVFRMKNLPND
jgi:hypothetical protein